MLKRGEVKVTECHPISRSCLFRARLQSVTGSNDMIRMVHEVDIPSKASKVNPTGKDDDAGSVALRHLLFSSAPPIAGSICNPYGQL